MSGLSSAEGFAIWRLGARFMAMNQHLVFRLLAPAFVLLLASCRGPSLAQRIDSGMQEFDSWPPETQEAIRAGRIEVGFTPEQVEMAWGEPDYVSREVRATNEAERWVWEKKSLPIGIGVGMGTGGRRGGVGGSVGTTVGGDSRIVRSVWFEEGVVESFSD